MIVLEVLERMETGSLAATSAMLHSCLQTLGVEKASKDAPAKYEMMMFRPLVAAFGSAVDANLEEAVNALVRGGVIVTPSGPRFRAENLSRFHARLRLQLGAEVADKVAPQIEDAVSSMYRAAKDVTARALKRKPRILQVDQESIDVLNQSSIWYTEHGYRRVFEPRINDLAQATLEEGYGSAELADRLFSTLDESIGRGEGYWQIVASQAVNSSRNFSQVNTYRQARIEKYQIVAVMDERTSQICRYLDGAEFRVAPAADNVQDILDHGAPTSDAEADRVMGLHPWVGLDSSRMGSKMPALFVDLGRGIKRFLPGSKVSEGGALTGHRPPEMVTLEELDLWLPPYHGHCRTTTVATEESVRLSLADESAELEVLR